MEPGESPKQEVKPTYYIRQVYCDLDDPARGVIVTGGRNDNSLQLMIDGNAVTVDRRAFACGMEAYRAP